LKAQFRYPATERSISAIRSRAVEVPARQCGSHDLRQPLAGAAADELFDPASLPSIEAITVNTDISGLSASSCARRVDGGQRFRQALGQRIRPFAISSASPKNQWDFNDPNAIPGFGPLPEDGQRAGSADAGVWSGTTTLAEMIPELPPNRPSSCCPPETDHGPADLDRGAQQALDGSASTSPGICHLPDRGCTEDVAANNGPHKPNKSILHQITVAMAALCHGRTYGRGWTRPATARNDMLQAEHGTEPGVVPRFFQSRHGRGSIAPVRRSMRLTGHLCFHAVPDAEMMERLALLHGDRQPARSGNMPRLGRRRSGRVKKMWDGSISICLSEAGGSLLLPYSSHYLNGCAVTGVRWLNYGKPCSASVLKKAPERPEPEDHVAILLRDHGGSHRRRNLGSGRRRS